MPMSDIEWNQRVDLAACYRLVAHFKWDDLVFTHISARLAGPEHHFLINPYGWTFDEITPSSLVVVDLDGRKVSDSPHDINPAGFVIHSAIHAAREDATCVLHTHSLDGVAVSASTPACSRSRSNRSSCSRRSAITITRASRCATTRSRGSCATSARTTS
jgi:ribulose-5-phosphate 4-epimerase/fuculose-1-phosphate aldolase